MTSIGGWTPVSGNSCRLSPWTTLSTPASMVTTVPRARIRACQSRPVSIARTAAPPRVVFVGSTKATITDSAVAAPRDGRGGGQQRPQAGARREQDEPRTGLCCSSATSRSSAGTAGAGWPRRARSATAAASGGSGRGSGGSPRPPAARCRRGRPARDRPGPPSRSVPGGPRARRRRRDVGGAAQRRPAKPAVVRCRPPGLGARPPLLAPLARRPGRCAVRPASAPTTARTTGSPSRGVRSPGSRS